MEKRSKRVSEWLADNDNLHAKVVADGRTITATLTLSGRTVYTNSSFATWDGAIKAINAQIQAHMDANKKQKRRGN